MTRPLRLRPAPPRPDLTVPVILAWADEFLVRFGRWPTRKDGRRGLRDTTWSAVDACLKNGSRGLAPGSSLARLLRDHRGRRHHTYPPPLTEDLILAWADAHHARTGDWPGQESAPVEGVHGETWLAVDCALRDGRRGLPGGSSLAQLLEAERGVPNPAAGRAASARAWYGFRNRATLPRLTVEQILAWADAHLARTGDWPRPDAGPVHGVRGERWSAVAAALETGCRGLPAGGSLAKLLADRRGVRNHMALPPYTVGQILAWADAHRSRTGEWPGGKDGPVADAPGETWRAVEQALAGGLRGLPGGDTLARLLARLRGKRNRKALPPLTLDQIRGWVKAHRRRTGKWPPRKGGPIPEAPGETWSAVDQALYRGLRGMPGGSSLPKVVEECRASG